MRLSELARQINDYIAGNGDVEVKALMESDVDGFRDIREPWLLIDDYGDGQHKIIKL